MAVGREMLRPLDRTILYGGVRVYRNLLSLALVLSRSVWDVDGGEHVGQHDDNCV